jgi:hypothetical protein
MEQPREIDVPLDATIRALHIIRNRRSLIAGNVKQIREYLLYGSIPAPIVLSK